MMLSLPKTKIRVLLLEGVNDSAARMFEANGYTELQRLPKALGPKSSGKRCQASICWGFGRGRN